MLIPLSKPERHRKLVCAKGPFDAGQRINKRVVELQRFPFVRKSERGDRILALSESKPAANPEIISDPPFASHLEAEFGARKCAHGEFRIDGRQFCAPCQPAFVDRRYFVGIRRRQSHVRAV